MQPKRDRGKIDVLFRILEIFQAYKEVNAGKILEILSAEGYFGDEKKETAKRRLLNYYLSELESLGYIELVGRGRAAKWILKKDFIQDSCFLVDDQKALILLGLLLSEDPFLRSTLYDWEKLFLKFELDPALAERLSHDTAVRNLWGINASKLLPLISRIAEAIRTKSYLEVKFKDGREARCLPLGIGSRAGFLYLVALDETGNRVYHKLEKLDAVSIKEQRYKGKKYPYLYPYLCLPGEKAFVFGLELNERVEEPSLLSFSRLVFHQEFEGNLLRKVFLVGFTGEYFASRFLPFAAYRILPPTPEIVRLAVRREVDKRFSDIPTDAEENLVRFRSFVANLKRRLEVAAALLDDLDNFLN